MKYYLSLFVLSAMLISSCKSDSSKESEVTNERLEEAQTEQALFDEVMIVHDEMMAKMEDMMRMKGRLIEKRDSVSQAGDMKASSYYNSLITQLENADEAMMSWMRHFKPQKEKPHEQIVDYYSAEKSKMDSVKVVMLKAISDAQKELN